MAQKVDYAALKKGGYMRQKQKGYGSLRLAVVGGNLTAENIKTVAEVAEKYGRGYVHMTSRQGIEIGRQDGDQRFALAGLHLRDAALMQHDAADELHAVRPHAEHAVRRLAADGKRLGQEVVEVLAALIALAELVRLFTQLLVRQRLHLVLHGLDARDERHKLLYFTLRAGAEDFLNDSHRMQDLSVGFSSEIISQSPT